eukprot:g17150.t1
MKVKVVRKKKRPDRSEAAASSSSALPEPVPVARSAAKPLIRQKEARRKAKAKAPLRHLIAEEFREDPQEVAPTRSKVNKMEENVQSLAKKPDVQMSDLLLKVLNNMKKK